MNRPYYAQLRQSLSSLLGKWTDEGLEFGNYDQDGAETVAIGQTRSGPISLSLSEDRLGAMLFAPPTEDFKPVWTLSAWLPGESSPQGHSVREVVLPDRSGAPIYTLALSPEERVLWLHHWEDGYNQLLPVTGILVELARLVRPDDRGRPSHEAFYAVAGSAGDEIIARALLEYNNRARKFDARDIVIQEKAASRGLLNFFSKRR